MCDKIILFKINFNKALDELNGLKFIMILKLIYLIIKKLKFTYDSKIYLEHIKISYVKNCRKYLDKFFIKKLNYHIIKFFCNLKN